MIVELTEEQVLFIQNRLEELGLNYVPLQGEILDHVCCMTEQKMGEGYSFAYSADAIFKVFGKDELKKLQDETISLTHQKSSLMKNIVFAFLTSLVVLAGFFFFPKEDNIKTEKAVPTPCPHKVISQPYHPDEKVSTAFEIFDKPPSRPPLNGDFHVTSGFGPRMHPIFKEKKLHLGIDFKAPMGTLIYATSDGTIEKAEYDEKHGNFISIKHDDEYSTKYSHMNELSVKVGEKVKKGDVIGKVGSSGMSTAPHLHYEVIKNGKRVNPRNYLTP
jgi:hypothetical protein